MGSSLKIMNIAESNSDEYREAEEKYEYSCKIIEHLENIYNDVDLYEFYKQYPELV